jgi:hypothetical protein
MTDRFRRNGMDMFDNIYRPERTQRNLFFRVLSYSGSCFISLLLFFAACTNPFATRDIEEPDLNNSSDIFDQAISSDIVLSNFRYAVVQKNISNYINCFVDPALAYNISYRFVPDQSLETDKFRDWDLNYEKIYLNTVFKQSSNISLDFLDPVIYTNISQAPDSVETNSFRYELRILIDGKEAVYSGWARMKLVKNITALWAIYYWEDAKLDEGDIKTWTSLKANYKN